MKRSKVHKLREAILKGSALLPVEEAIEVPELYKKWETGEVFELENTEVPFVIRRHNDVLYKLIQVHTTQDGWTPDLVPALWKLYTPEGVIAEWVQPLGSYDAYKLGDKVTWNGKTWESTVANTADGKGQNVWEPGVYGWVEI